MIMGMSVHPDEAAAPAYATDRRAALSDLYRSERLEALA
jgi:hypothetical protein